MIKKASSTLQIDKKVNVAFRSGLTSGYRAKDTDVARTVTCRNSQNPISPLS